MTTSTSVVGRPWLRCAFPRRDTQRRGANDLWTSRIGAKWSVGRLQYRHERDDQALRKNGGDWFSDGERSAICSLRSPGTDTTRKPLARLGSEGPLRWMDRHGVFSQVSTERHPVSIPRVHPD